MSKTENKLIKIDQPFYFPLWFWIYLNLVCTYYYCRIFFQLPYLLTDLLIMNDNYLVYRAQSRTENWAKVRIGGWSPEKKPRVWSRPNPLPPSGPDRPLLVHTCVNCNPGGSLHNFTTTAQWNTRRGCYFKLKNTQTPLNHVVFHV